MRLTQAIKISNLLKEGKIVDTTNCKRANLDDPLTKKYRYKFIAFDAEKSDFVDISMQVDSFTTFVNRIYDLIK